MNDKRCYSVKELQRILEVSRQSIYASDTGQEDSPLGKGIWSLDQREDWATIVCLVGGGQEINTGEAARIL